MFDKDAVYLDVDKVEHDGEREEEDFLAKMADANLQAEKNGSRELMTLLVGGNNVERRPADFGDGEEKDEEDNDDLKGEEKESEHKIEGIERKELASDSEEEEMYDFDANEMDGKLLETQQELGGSEEENSSDKDPEQELNFKCEIHKRASSSFFARQSASVNLRALFYDKDPTKLKIKGRDFFVKIMELTPEIDDKDQTRSPFLARNALDDEENILTRAENLAAIIKGSFITGNWGEEDAEKLLQEDYKLHGYFEDLEKGLDIAIDENETEVSGNKETAKNYKKQKTR
ncbi:unnamed protein product [Oikopleura dioica]|uniref:Uncharacterized protein n=1 Tax=Oikopleura dioica TaxID=34765 RepID=E4XQQ7_OIKDI|nr:unnamed protein product [Oikopleura dioica]